jgi:hypothetical protein
MYQSPLDPQAPSSHSASHAGTGLLVVSALLILGSLAVTLDFADGVTGNLTLWRRISLQNFVAYAMWFVVLLAAVVLAARLIWARPNEKAALWLTCAVAGCAFNAAVSVDTAIMGTWQWPSALAARLVSNPPDSIVAQLVTGLIRSHLTWMTAIGLLAPGFALLMFSVRFPGTMAADALRRPLLKPLLAAALAWPLAPAASVASDPDDEQSAVAVYWVAMLSLWLAAAQNLPVLAGLAASLVGFAVPLAFVWQRRARVPVAALASQWPVLLAAGVLSTLGWAWAALDSGNGTAQGLMSASLAVTGAAFALQLRRSLADRAWVVLAAGAVVSVIAAIEVFWAPAGVTTSAMRTRLLGPWALACLGAATVNLMQAFFDADDDDRQRIRITLVGLGAAVGMAVVHVTTRFYVGTQCLAGADAWDCVAATRVSLYSKPLVLFAVTLGAAVAVLARGDIAPNLRWTRTTMLGLGAVAMFVVFVGVEFVVEQTLGDYLPSWSPGVIGSLVAAGLVHVLKHPFESALARVMEAGQGATPVLDHSDVSSRDRNMARMAFALAALVGVLYARELVQGNEVEPIAAVIARTQQSVYLLVVKEGNSERALATAWVYSPTELATNAHVVESINQAIKDKGVVVARRTHGDFADLPIASVAAHPAYTAYRRTWYWLTPSRRDAAGRLQPIGYAPSYDVGLLTVAEGATLDAPLPRADAAALGDLGPQTPLVYVGFPSEGLLEQNLHRPVPISQQGFLSGFETPTRTRVTSPDGATVLVHSIPATGGASGGPVIDARGRVVGLMNGINTIVQGTGERAPNAVQVNFAQRVDLLDEVATTTDDTVAGLRQGWRREFGSAFVVMPDAPDDFLAARVRAPLELGAAVSMNDARVYTREMVIPPRTGDAGGFAQATLDFSGRGPFLVTALDPSRDVDLRAELSVDGGWRELGKDELATGVASVLLKDVTGTIRLTVTDADNRPRSEAPAGPVRLDVYRKP